MAITTLVDYWQQEVTSYTTAVAATGAALAAAQAALSAARTAREATVKALAAGKTDIAAKRARLATTTIPAEALALLADIRNLIEAQRALQGTLLDDTDAADLAQADADIAADAAQRAGGRLADAKAGLEAAREAATVRDQLKLDLAAAPLSAIKADATAFAAGAVATAAETQLDTKDFPGALLARAKARYAIRTEHLAALREDADKAANALGARRGTSGGLDGVVERERVPFERADRSATHYAATAKTRYDQAVKVITAVADIQTNPAADFMTPAELAQVASNAARAAAATGAAALDADRRGVTTALKDLNATLLTRIDADVDTLSTDPTVAAKRGAVTTAVTKLATDIGTWAADAKRKTMDDWQVVCQDDDWQRLVEYLDARATLAELAAITTSGAASALVETLTASETKYAQALGNAGIYRRQREAFEDEADVRERRHDAAANAASGRLLSAIRGDSF